MSEPRLIEAISKKACIILIGMAGAGKSTTSKALARRLSWAFADSDHIIESVYGTHLQNIANALTKEEFLDTESFCIQRLRLNKTVLATGGSVIYRENSMKHLASLGHIVFLNVSLGLILERIAKNPDRGLAIAPGQTIEDLFYEREALYKKYAHFVIDADDKNPSACVDEIIKILPSDLLID